MATQLQRMSQLVLYKLKRDYGGPIDIYKLVNSQTDVKTGQKVVTTSVNHIHRAIILPAGWSRVRMPAISSANKDFPVGGAHDSNVREFIVDRKDAPGLTTLTADDWIVYQGRKYQISKVESFEFDSGWIITAKELVGEVP
jgi:hypothetical protein